MIINQRHQEQKNIIKRPTRELKDTLRALDEINAELRAKNTQLSKVRETALAIDGLTTKSQVFKTVVESARDIPGVRFVMLLNWQDDEREYVMAPYVSKIRNKAIGAALNAVNFDIEKILGDQPDSNKFRYLSSKSKLQKTFVLNPKTMNISSVAEVFEGIFPKVISDSVQRIAGIKMVTIIPIIIDKSLWGSIIFFLNDSVPTDILEMVGAHCSLALKNAANIETLEHRNVELRHAEQLIKTSLAEKEVLLKEIHHRVKNNMQVISSLIDLQSQSVIDEPTKLMLTDTQERIKSMALIYNKLYRSSDLEHIGMKEYILELVPNLIKVYTPNFSQVKAEFEIDEIAFDLDTAMPCSLVINELVTNALKYAFPGNRHGVISVSLKRDGGNYCLIVSDDGVGLPEGFNPLYGQSLGMKLVHTLIENQLSGKVELEPVIGTSYKIIFPIK